MKHDDKSILKYMNQWINQETWDDFAVMSKSGDIELYADALCRSGAINSENCYDWAKSLEQDIESLAKNWRKLSRKTQLKRIDKCFSDSINIECDECNHVSFVHSGNEQLYPEVLTKCWECGSTKINITKK